MIIDGNLIKILNIILTIVLIFGIIIVIFAYNDGNKCLSNPFLYGVNKIINENSGELTCTCSFESPNYAPFYFNSEEIKVLGSYNPNLDYNFLFNLS